MDENLVLFIYLLLIPLLIGMNAFFVIIEFTVVAARKPRLKHIGAATPRTLALVLQWVEEPSARNRIIAAAQLGVTLVSLVLGAIGEQTVEILVTRYLYTLPLAEYSWGPAILRALPLVLSFLFVTGLHVIFGEQVPKVAALQMPEKALLKMAWGMQVFLLTFRWFIDLLDATTRNILRALGFEQASEDHFLSLDELRLVLQEAQEVGVLPSEEGEILDAVLDLRHLLVRQVMIPRTDIVAIEADAPASQILHLAAKHDLTKFPVYEGDLDHVIGLAHVKQVLKVFSSPEFPQMKARDVASEVIFVPETLPVGELLRLFREKRQHLALVVDEFGGVAGLVTLEDVLEEIVGEVSDPFDHETPDVEFLPDGTVRIDGMALMEDVNETLNLNLHSPHYDTMAGFLLDRLGHIPKEGESVVLEEEGVKLTVERMDGLRIDKIRLEWLHPRPAPMSLSSPEDRSDSGGPG